MGKKVIVVLVSLLSSFIIMSGGYGKWTKQIIIEGDITVIPDPKVIEGLKSSIIAKQQVIEGLQREQALLKIQEEERLLAEQKLKEEEEEKEKLLAEQKLKEEEEEKEKLLAQQKLKEEQEAKDKEDNGTEKGKGAPQDHQQEQVPEVDVDQPVEETNNSSEPSTSIEDDDLSTQEEINSSDD